eukprot:GHVP01021661.1.p1 GENE.GHVP01021661.1~~GHVP01021661.1.p1  ORF type:complete len:298 (-),score=18.34 GHVP01021661.1:90-983(-)
MISFKTSNIVRSEIMIGPIFRTLDIVLPLKMKDSLELKREKYAKLRAESMISRKKQDMIVNSSLWSWGLTILDIIVGAIFLSTMNLECLIPAPLRVYKDSISIDHLLLGTGCLLGSSIILVNWTAFKSPTMKLLGGSIHSVSKWLLVRFSLVKATFFTTSNNPSCLAPAYLIYIMPFIVCGIIEVNSQTKPRRAIAQSIVLTIATIIFIAIGYYKDFLVYKGWKKGRMPLPIDDDFVSIGMLFWFSIATPISALLIRTGVISKGLSPIKGSLYLSSPITTIFFTLVKALLHRIGLRK